MSRLRRIADEKRAYMFTMQRLLEEEKRKLDVLLQNRGLMSADEFDRELRYRNYIIAQREEYYRQAVDDYIAAEREAP